MNILSGLGFVIVNVIYSNELKVNAKDDCLVSIANEGYKYDKKLLDKYFEKQNTNKLKINEKKDAHKFLNAVIAFTPIINLFQAYFYRINMKRNMIKSSEFNKALIPMTNEEINEFESQPDRNSMLQYIGVITPNSQQENISYNKEPNFNHTYIQSKIEITNIHDEKENIDNNNIKKIHIRHNELLPLGYTLNDIKKLNDALTVKLEDAEVKFEYKVGKLNNEYVAIIGIPNLNKAANEKVSIEVMGNIMEELPDDIANKYTFSVYPQIIYSEQEHKNLENAIEDIKQMHDNYDKQYNNYNLDDELNESDIFNKQSHTLKKTLKYR